MSRMIFKKNRSKHASISSPSISDVSATELSYLKAEVWSLQNNLRKEKISIKNLSVRKCIKFQKTLLDFSIDSFRNPLKSLQAKNMNFLRN